MMKKPNLKLRQQMTMTTMNLESDGVASDQLTSRMRDDDASSLVWPDLEILRQESTSVVAWVE